MWQKYEKNMKVIFSFFMPKFMYKELIFMFSDSVLEKIFAMPDMQMLDLQTQSNIVHGMEKIMEEEEKKNADEFQSDGNAE